VSKSAAFGSHKNPLDEEDGGADVTGSIEHQILTMIVIVTVSKT
jgi:hypothetical protein